MRASVSAGVRVGVRGVVAAAVGLPADFEAPSRPEADYGFTLRTGAVFSADSKWLAYLVGVSPKERDRLSKEKKPIRTSFRLIAATNVDLDKAVKDAYFGDHIDA